MVSAPERNAQTTGLFGDQRNSSVVVPEYEFLTSSQSREQLPRVAMALADSIRQLFVSLRASNEEFVQPNTTPFDNDNENDLRIEPLQHTDNSENPHDFSDNYTSDSEDSYSDQFLLPDNFEDREDDRRERQSPVPSHQPMR